MGQRPQIAVADDPRQASVVGAWREYGYLRGTIRLYLGWVRQFRRYCAVRLLVEDRQLTRTGITTFARVYARERRIDHRWVRAGSHIALHAWARGLGAIGVAVPVWVRPPGPPPFAALVEEFCQFRRQRRGIAESSLRGEAAFVRAFLFDVRRHGRSVSAIRLIDIDRFVARLGTRVVRRTVASACSALRGFLRFLHASGRVGSDLSSSVMAPTVRAGDRPPRVLPWGDVRRIVQSINRTTALGRRDFALLLLMASYGLGAGEALRLRLADVDWQQGTLRIVRPKTGVETLLPLLPAVGQALAAYLRRGRSRRATASEIFIRGVAPYRPLSGAGAVTHVLHKHAAKAGVSAPFLGSHMLRHSYACRQIEAGAPPKVLSDILGHADPSSTSVYVRVAMRRLRVIALPVPR